jgi:hypothetical protein
MNKNSVQKLTKEQEKFLTDALWDLADEFNGGKIDIWKLAAEYEKARIVAIPVAKA